MYFLYSQQVISILYLLSKIWSLWHIIFVTFDLLSFRYCFKTEWTLAYLSISGRIVMSSFWKKNIIILQFQDIERRWKNLDLRSPGIRPKRKPNPLPRIIPQPSESPINSPPFKSSPLSTPNTPIPHPNILPNPDPVKVIVKLPDKPTTSYNPYDAPPLPPKPKGVERRPDTSPPPPPLPPRQPPLPPRTTPIRGVLESRSPHMDPVEPRRENSHFFLQQNKTTQSPPPAVVPRRHSHIVNGSQSGMFEKSLEIYRLDIIN